MTDAKAAAASQAAPQAAKNTDREIWREHPDDYYADSIHVTEGGGIGLDCGGHVIVMPIRKWHALAAETRALPASGQAAAPPVEAVGQQGADAIELASATLTADEVRSAIAGSVRTQDDGKVVADEEAMTRLLNETLASKATPAGAAVGVEAVRTTLETHTWDDEDGCAGCGWTPDSEATWAEHILALLAAPRTEKPGGRR